MHYVSFSLPLSPTLFCRTWFCCILSTHLHSFFCHFLILFCSSSKTENHTIHDHHMIYHKISQMNLNTCHQVNVCRFDEQQDLSCLINIIDNNWYSPWKAASKSSIFSVLDNSERTGRLWVRIRDVTRKLVRMAAIINDVCGNRNTDTEYDEGNDGEDDDDVVVLIEYERNAAGGVEAIFPFLLPSDHWDESQNKNEWLIPTKQWTQLRVLLFFLFLDSPSDGWREWTDSGLTHRRVKQTPKCDVMWFEMCEEESAGKRYDRIPKKIRLEREKDWRFLNAAGEGE